MTELVIVLVSSEVIVTVLVVEGLVSVDNVVWVWTDSSMQPTVPFLSVSNSESPSPPDMLYWLQLRTPVLAHLLIVGQQREDDNVGATYQVTNACPFGTP